MTPHEYLLPRLKRALLDLGLAVPDDGLFAPHTRSPDIDAVITAALVSTCRGARRAMDVATDIRDRLDVDTSDVSNAQVAEPGFINISLSPRFFAQALQDEATRWRVEADAVPVSDAHPAAMAVQQAIARIDGLLRHAAQLGIDIATDCDLAPLHASSLDIQLVKTTTNLLHDVRSGRTSTALRIGGERHLAGIESFYYGCRVIAAPTDLRNARLRLLQVARLAALQMCPLPG